MTGSEGLLQVRGLAHAYEGKRVLHAIDLDLQAGQLAILTGPSGCGKSTLLTLVGALRSIQAGSVHYAGRELAGLSHAERVEHRRRLGFVFQAHNLFPSLTGREHVRMVLDLHPALARREKERRTDEVLARLGLSARAHARPDQLSGGERQRVAIARALVHRPALVLADEPTAALDPENSREVVRLLLELVREERTTVLLVTHDARIFDAADRLLHMVDGRLASDLPVQASLELCELLGKDPRFAGLSALQLVRALGLIRRAPLPAGETPPPDGERLHLVRDGQLLSVAVADLAALRAEPAGLREQCARALFSAGR